jgi:hypothetical protein
MVRKLLLRWLRTAALEAEFPQCEYVGATDWQSVGHRLLILVG